MTYDFTNLTITANEEVPLKAAKLFAQEIKTRIGNAPEIKADSGENYVGFFLCDEKRLPHKDCYELELDREQNALKIYAWGIRGLIMGYGHFLRKTTYKDGRITLIKDVSGKYIPDKKIRGHQVGYRICPNTYDAWSPEDVYRYYLDFLYFGCNITELLPPDYPEDPKNYNRLMKYDQQAFMNKCSAYAAELDMDISVWFPNDDEPMDKTVELRKKVLEQLARVNVLFPPGGDPGEYPAEEFIERTIAISKGVREVCPDIQMWPSAQAPHGIPNWGEEFVKAINSAPDGAITGFIQGPNRAFEIDEIRKRVDRKYPLRLYPDITHNVRCEYSVHYPSEDWHYALASANGRESINPRPSEYRRIHRLTSPYTVGSVSYSEGVNDDVNKFVWGSLEFNRNANLMEILEDYVRLFMWDAPSEACASGIMGLEYNWIGDPCENPSIENTAGIFRSILEKAPVLDKNWRFQMCIFRAEFDLYIKMRRSFELGLIDEMQALVRRGELQKAQAVLETDFSDDYYRLHDELVKRSDALFELIGMQTSVEKHCASHWERGAVMETMDRPVTNRQWLLKRFEKALAMEPAESAAYMQKVIDRDIVDTDEVYFSFAEHGYAYLNMPQQGGEPYIAFMGDKPENEHGDIPMEMVKVYDHYSLRGKFGGLTANCDYQLRVTFHDCHNEGTGKFYIRANDTVIYEGVRYGGEKDSAFDEMMLAPGFLTMSYVIPESVIQNGCLEIIIGEEEKGCEISEFWITKKDVIK